MKKDKTGRRIFRFITLMLALLIILPAGCSRASKQIPQNPVAEVPAVTEQITEDGYYYDLESVVLYYDTYGKLPSNYVTKNDAKSLGWEGGRLDPFQKDAAIGGDHFGNYEKKLPAGKRVKYIECDIDTHKKSRGAKRLIISNDGKYYYTDDHYDSFRRVVIRDGEVTFADSVSP